MDSKVELELQTSYQKFKSTKMKKKKHKTKKTPIFAVEYKTNGIPKTNLQWLWVRIWESRLWEKERRREVTLSEGLDSGAVGFLRHRFESLQPSSASVRERERGRGNG